MNLIRQATPSGYEKIRKYFFTQLTKSAGVPMRLASSREVAKEFGVTHTTVVRALKDLIDGGYLTVKKGVGVFTNPGKVSTPPDSRVIGMFFGDGKTTLLTRMYVQLSLNFADNLLSRSPRFQVLHSFISADVAHAAQEIASSGLDGVIWFKPCATVLPLLKTLRETTRLALFVVGARQPGISSLDFNPEDDDYRSVTRMLAMGRRRIMLLGPENDGDPTSVGRGYNRALAEAGLTCDPALIVADTEAVRQDFPRLLEQLKPDGIVFKVNINRYWPYFRANPALIDRCLCLSGDWSLYRDMGFRGLAGFPLLRDAAETAAENIAAQLETPDTAAVIEKDIKTKIEIKGDIRS